jgi:hypothetical protein
VLWSWARELATGSVKMMPASTLNLTTPCEQLKYVTYSLLLIPYLAPVFVPPKQEPILHTDKSNTPPNPQMFPNHDDDYSSENDLLIPYVSPPSPPRHTSNEDEDEDDEDTGCFGHCWHCGAALPPPGANLTGVDCPECWMPC